MDLIDLRRVELRFLLHECSIDTFITYLTTDCQLHEKVFKKHWITSVYFLDDAHSRTFTESFRARQRRKRKHSRFRLPLQGSFLCSASIGGKSEKRKSAPRRLCFEEIEAWAKAESALPDVRPFVLAHYSRRHFKNAGGSIRVTIDSCCQFFLFERGNVEAVPLEPSGEAEFRRVEVKYRRNASASAENIMEELRRLGALPVISKKGQALDLYGSYLSKRYGIGAKKYKELPGKAIEVKFTLEGSRVEHMYAHLLQRDFSPLRRDEHYPYVVTVSTCNCYFGRHHDGGMVEAVKLVLQGSNISVVRKGQGYIMNRRLGIIERSEEKHFGTVYDGRGGLCALVAHLGHGLIHVGNLFRFKKSA